MFENDRVAILSHKKYNHRLMLKIVFDSTIKVIFKASRVRKKYDILALHSIIIPSKLIGKKTN